MVIYGGIKNSVFGVYFGPIFQKNKSSAARLAKKSQCFDLCSCLIVSQSFPCHNSLSQKTATLYFLKVKSCLPKSALSFFLYISPIFNISFPIKGMDRETGLRICYRWARNRNVERAVLGAPYFESASAAYLLLHQMAELLPTMFHAARIISEDQINAKGSAA